MKLLIFHFALLFAVVISNPINSIEDPIEKVNENPEYNAANVSVKRLLRTDTEYGDKFQGDIMLSPEQDESLTSETGIMNTIYRWPKSGGFVRVPYVFNIGFTTAQRDIIKSAMAEIQSKTCIKFNLKKKNETNFVRFTSATGCWSYIGKQGGVQIISLEVPGCVDKGVAMHEIIHALGYGHQHSHYQRDQKISILWNNIMDGQDSQFTILSPNEYSNFGTPYDMDSIMHYSEKAFSKNGQLTIQAKNPADQNRLGQRNVLSAGDITRIKKMYGC